MIRKRRRFARMVLGVLIVSSVALCSVGCRESKNSPEKYPEALPQVESAVAKLLTRYKIDAKSVRRRKVANSDGTFERIEKRISVGPEFNPLTFNHDLNLAVSEFGATVIASEKSEDKSVTMHIKKDGIILQSIVFVVVNKEN